MNALRDIRRAVGLSQEAFARLLDVPYDTGSIDRVQEPTEFPRAVAGMAFADHATGPHVEGGKQGRHPMTNVIVRVPLG